MEFNKKEAITPERVQTILSEHLLTKGMMPMVLDMERSQGIDLYDKMTGRHFYDFFGFYASNAVGMNHPKMLDDRAFLARLQQAALNKVTNSDVMTDLKARFVQTFDRIGIPSYLPYTFFIDGGALGIENALKAAFDWKVRKNFRKGYDREIGHQVMHFEQAFHGRTGYTLSLTNTADPTKTKYFPKFDWPRLPNPRLQFPLTEESIESTIRREHSTLELAKQYFLERKDDIACVIIEPIQAEGGDNHFRPEFLQALRDLTHENDALLIFDEVQCGVGITGAFWAHQSLGVEPDIIAFGKKTQVCGILAGHKLDEIDDHVFRVPSRINSTWGGNLVDMVRFDKILEIMEEDDLVTHAGTAGAYLLEALERMSEDCVSVKGVRGRGLMCAFDLPDKETRNRVIDQCYEKGLVILGCGSHTIRFRSPLIITEEELDRGVAILKEAILEVEQLQAAPHLSLTGE